MYLLFSLLPFLSVISRLFPIFTLPKTPVRAIVLFVGRVQITPLQYGPLLMAMKIGFAVFVVLSIPGIFFSLKRGNLRGTAMNEDQRQTGIAVVSPIPFHHYPNISKRCMRR